MSAFTQTGIVRGGLGFERDQLGIDRGLGSINGAVAESAFEADSDLPRSNRTTTPLIGSVLVVGGRRLYLGALCELLNSIPGLSASLAGPDDLFASTTEPGPGVILIDDPADSGSVAQLAHVVRETYPDAALVLLSSRSGRGNPETAAALRVSGRMSTTLSAAELVKGLFGRGIPDRLTKTLRPERVMERPRWRLADLTEREMSVLRLVVGGRTNDEIGHALCISRHTVRSHVQNIMNKMLVRSRPEIVRVALKSGIRAVPAANQS